MSITFGKPRFVEEDELLGESYENISMCYGDANRTTIAHELMHSLGLNHTFSNFRRHTNNNENLLDFSLKKNKTDNIMDYDWKKVNAPDSSDNDFKGKMYSFFKWQWEIMRRDRSLIFNY